MIANNLFIFMKFQIGFSKSLRKLDCVEMENSDEFSEEFTM